MSGNTESGYSGLNKGKSEIDQFLSNTQAPSTLGSSTGMYSSQSSSAPLSSYESAPITAQQLPRYDGLGSTAEPFNTGTVSSSANLGSIETNPFRKTSSLSDNVTRDTFDTTGGRTAYASDAPTYATTSVYDQGVDRSGVIDDRAIGSVVTGDTSSRTSQQAGSAVDTAKDNLTSAKNQVNDTASQAYQKAAEVTPSTQDVKQTAAHTANTIQGTVQSGLASVSNYIGSAVNSASQTANRILETSKQNIAKGTEAARDTAAQGAASVRQTHEQITTQSRTTPVSADSSGGPLSLDKILEMNSASSLSKTSQEPEAPQIPEPPQPKMVYAMAAPDGSVKVLGDFPEGVSRSQVDRATGNTASSGQVGSGQFQAAPYSAQGASQGSMTGQTGAGYPDVSRGL